jgi:uncharacterized membrane protein YebE (DUF533 family)
MFIGWLSDSEKDAFVCLANKIALADGIVTEEETAFLDNMVKEMGGGENGVKLPESEAFKIAAALDNKGKRSFYVELLSLVMADNSVAPQEKNCMKEIQGKLGLPDNFVNEAEVWLTEYLALVARGYGLIEG